MEKRNKITKDNLNIMENADDAIQGLWMLQNPSEAIKRIKDVLRIGIESYRCEMNVESMKFYKEALQEAKNY